MNDSKYEHFTSISCNEVIIPDDILIRDGIACGDYFIIQASIDDNFIHFIYKCDSCDNCKAIIGYIYKKYNYNPYISVLSEMQQLITDMSSDFDSTCLKIFGINNLREECVLTPLKLIYKFFLGLGHLSIDEQTTKNTQSTLDCDACTSTSRINWQKKEVSCVNRGKVITTAEYPLEFREKWMPLSKIYLNEQEINSLRNHIGNVTNKDFLMLAKMKIDQMIFFNANKFQCTTMIPSIWKNLYYRQYRQELAKKEIIKIKSFLDRNHLHALFVKGAYMHDKYEGKGLRLFIDYDMVADSASTAFKIATFLFNSDYKIFYGEFSLKTICDNGSITTTGHFHLQKRIYNQYQIIIDINFPGFPLGRVSLYYPHQNDTNVIALEDEFIITLCHLFKHQDVFMKDINDLYILLCSNINLSVIKDIVIKYNLGLFAYVALTYIKDNYDLPISTVKEIELLFITEEYQKYRFCSWPYNYNQVFNVKHIDFEIRTKEHQDIQRIYLFPLVIFNKFCSISKQTISSIEDKYCEVNLIARDLVSLTIEKNEYFITGMGIFWNYNNSIDNRNRTIIELILNELVKIMGMTNEIVFLPYYLENQSKWFD